MLPRVCIGGKLGLGTWARNQTQALGCGMWASFTLFYKIYFIYLRVELKRGRDRDLPFTGSVPKRLQWLGLGLAEAKRQERCLVSLTGVRAQALVWSLLLFQWVIRKLDLQKWSPGIWLGIHMECWDHRWKFNLPCHSTRPWYVDILTIKLNACLQRPLLIIKLRFYIVWFLIFMHYKIMLNNYICA